MGLTRSDIIGALEALAQALPARRSPHELWVVGGAAIVLLYGTRETTKDVDAFLSDPDGASALRVASRSIAGALGLPDDWLNDAAKGYVKGLAPGNVLFRASQLLVRTMAPHQLLAMKLSAWRDDLDISDARLLLTKVAGDHDAVWGLIEPHLVPGRELKARYAFEDLWEADRGPA